MHFCRPAVCAKRFCGAEGLEQVKTLSTLRGGEFLANYGVAIASGPLAGLAARAVLVLDENNTVLVRRARGGNHRKSRTTATRWPCWANACQMNLIGC